MSLSKGGRRGQNPDLALRQAVISRAEEFEEPQVPKDLELLADFRFDVAVFGVQTRQLGCESINRGLPRRVGASVNSGLPRARTTFSTRFDFACRSECAEGSSVPPRAFARGLVE